MSSLSVCVTCVDRVFWCDEHSVQSVSVDGSARIVHVMSPAYSFVAISLHVVIIIKYTTAPCLRKNSQNCFCYNFVKFLLTLIFFGMLMANTTKLCNVHLFSI